MVTEPTQGDIWWAETEGGRRPVLVVTRAEAALVLRRLVVAPITRTVRKIPTEIPLGPEHGLRVECAAAFDDIQPVSRGFLVDRVGSLGPSARDQICRALDALADC